MGATLGSTTRCLFACLPRLGDLEMSKGRSKRTSGETSDGGRRMLGRRWRCICVTCMDAAALRGGFWNDRGSKSKNKN